MMKQKKKRVKMRETQNWHLLIETDELVRRFTVYAT